MQPVPGWYPSPQHPDSQQYWDGNSWTDQVRPTVVQNASPKPKHFHIKSSTALRVLGVLIMLAAAIPLLITAPVIVPSVVGSSDRAEVTGTVYDFDYSTTTSTRGRSKTTQKTCAALANFTVDGEQYKAKTDIYTAPCEWKIGQEVKIRYDKSNPASTGVITYSSGVLWAFFLVGSAIAALGLGLVAKSFFLKSEKKQRAR